MDFQLGQERLMVKEPWEMFIFYSFYNHIVSSNKNDYAEGGMPTNE